MSFRPFLLALATLFIVGCSTKRFVAASHPNGKPEVIIYMKGKDEEAIKVMEKVYYPTGQMEYVGRFQNGVEHGEWIYYYESGVKKYSETWENGLEQGIHYDYSPDGQVYRELHYDKGRLVKEVDRSKQ